MKKTQEHYYHGTIKKLITVFGSVFNDLYYITDRGEKRKVPLYYAPREKFLTHNLESADMKRLQVSMPTPRLGFELTGMNYAPERQLNPMNRLESKNDKQWQYNRVCYDFAFSLYLLAKDFETSLKIIEQVIPLFSPSLNVTIDEVIDYKHSNDVAIILNSVAHDIDYLGDFSQQRNIMWTLQFTMKAYLYNANQLANRIKETIIRLSPGEMDAAFDDMTSLVVPRSAEKSEPHEIVDSNQPRRDIFGEEP